MDDLRRVRFREALGDRDHDIDRVLPGERALLPETLRQRVLVDELHRDERDLGHLVGGGVVSDDDIRVGELSRRPRLEKEPLQKDLFLFVGDRFR